MAITKTTKTVVLKQGMYPAKIVGRKVVEKCAEAYRYPVTNNTKAK